MALDTVDLAVLERIAVALERIALTQRVDIESKYDGNASIETLADRLVVQQRNELQRIAELQSQ